MSAYRLTQEIMDRSVAKTWAEAKPEWEIAEVYRAGQADACLCGHFPIQVRPHAHKPRVPSPHNQGPEKSPAGEAAEVNIAP